MEYKGAFSLLKTLFSLGFKLPSKDIWIGIAIPSVYYEIKALNLEWEWTRFKKMRALLDGDDLSIIKKGRLEGGARVK